MCVIWGLPYLFIRIAVDSVDPGTLVFVRTALASLVLLPIALVRREVRAVLPHWRPVAAFTVVEIMVPWLLLGHAEQRISSSLTGLLISAVPLFGALAFLLTATAERFSRGQVGGLLLGFVGVASLVGLDVGSLDVLAIVEVLAVAVCYAGGPLILSRWLSDLPAFGVMACALTLTTIVFAPYGLMQPLDEIPAEAWGSIVVLALVCSALAFVLFFLLISEVGPTRATVIIYVNPAVAVALGVLLLDEEFTTGMLVGLPLILIGSVVAAGGSRPQIVELEDEPVCAPS
jgi:drug/metabolite transporter (DMT)-like permease